MKDCFPPYNGKCVSYGGRLFPETVAYTIDDSVDDAIEKLTKYVNSIQKESGQTINLELSSVGSTCVGKLRESSFNYEIKARESSAEFSFNLSSTTKQLPTNFNVVSSGVEIVTNTSNIVKLNGDINGASFSPSDFPINAKYFLNVDSPCGLIILSKDVKTFLKDDKVSTYLTIHDFGDNASETFKSTEEAIVFLNERINSLENKLDNRTKVKDGLTVSEYIYNVNNDLNSAINKSDQVKDELDESSVFDKVDSLINEVENLSKTVDSLKVENKNLKTDLDQLQKDVSTKT